MDRLTVDESGLVFVFTDARSGPEKLLKKMRRRFIYSYTDIWVVYDKSNSHALHLQDVHSAVFLMAVSILGRKRIKKWEDKVTRLQKSWL